ncbi:MAG: hypothetical protein WBR26_03040 [Candidatus Acidiferrum sp.]
MLTFAVHPEVHVHEQVQRPEYSTCFECHRSFHAKSEDQLSVSLCDHCFDAARHVTEPVVSVHVRVRPHGHTVV